VKNNLDLLYAADYMYNYLRQHNFQFNEYGFPVFRPEMFIDEWPEMVIPYKNRKHYIVKNPKKTLLCFYSPDIYLYPRIEKLEDDMEEYKRFMGCVFCDITVTWDLPQEMQEYLILVNHLHAAVLAVNGIKLAANLRIGNEETLKCLEGIPVNVMCASGFLGCKNLKGKYDFSFLNKIMQVMPYKLILFGKKDRIVEEQLYKNGICFKRYGDYNENRRSRPAALTSKSPANPNA